MGTTFIEVQEDTDPTPPIAGFKRFFVDSVDGLFSCIDAGGIVTKFAASLTQENVEDIVGDMVTGNTETLIAVTYDDPAGKLDFAVEDNLNSYDNTTSDFINSTDLLGGETF
jgi:hypothetical protein